MKVLVTAKRVVDYKVKIRVKADQSAVEDSNVKMSMNPFDEIAVEEAIRLKEQGSVTEIIAVSIGPTQCQEVIRAALALGADRGIHIDATTKLEPLHTAKCLKHIVERDSIDLVIMGKQSIDGDNNQTGQMLAAMLNWPQGTFASQVKVLDKQIEVTREVDGGLETLLLNLPAVITTDLRLNEPRYASLPNIMKAKRKTIETMNLADMNIDTAPRMTVQKVEPPAERQAGIRVADAAELVHKLHTEEQVI